MVRFNPAITFFYLENKRFFLLISREAVIAFRAGSTTTDSATFIGKAAFQNSRVFMTTTGATQI
jgi:hypothetical protein